MDQQIFAIRLTKEEANALLDLLDKQNGRALGRIHRRLERIVEQIGEPNEK